MNEDLFRPGTWDRDIFISVVVKNEYRLPDDLSMYTVVDIGACFGAFTYACLIRRARQVLSFEPHPENFSLLIQHLASQIAENQVEAYNLAVWGKSGLQLRLSECEFNNTGGHAICADGPYEVETISLNDILSGLEWPVLIKLDCEGSEWQILYNCDKRLLWEKCQGIVGEFHNGTDPGDRIEVLHSMLEGVGYHNHFHYENDWLGKFQCHRS